MQLYVDMALCRVPIMQEQQLVFIVGWEENLYIDHTGPFGPSSSPGVFGRLSDTLITIHKSRGIAPIKKWVDEFLFLQYILESSPLAWPPFNYNLKLIVCIADDLGWPWKEAKTCPFVPTFTYLGFLWSLRYCSFKIPTEKQKQFLVN